jgi:putative nucleotidyltransferase with HDIG domain
MLKPVASARERYKNIEAKTHEVDVSELTMPGELLRRLRVFLVTGSSKIPMLPEIATRLLDLSNRPNVQITDIVREVERDATIAGRLLATANSAFYSRGIPATSVRQAIVRVGMGEARDIVYRLVAAANLFRLPEYADAVRQIRGHSILSAYITRDICRRARLDHELAFLCGLLHDVGKVILLAATVASCGSKAKPPPIEELLEVLRADHPEASALCAEYWKLPAQLVTAVRHHHSVGATEEPYAFAVALADRICRHLGCEGDAEPMGAEDAPLVAKLGFSDAALRDVLHYAAQVKTALDRELDH